MIPLLIISVLALGLVIRLIAGQNDVGRIDRYFRERGSQLLNKRWAPMGPGWFGEKSDRIYEVSYRDQEGSVHKAFVKTSAWSGVYVTEDRIVEHSTAAAPPVRNLEEENRELKARLAALESQLDTTSEQNKRS